MDRRRFLLLAGGTAVGVAACSKSAETLVSPTDPQIRAVEEGRASSGGTVSTTLRPSPTEIDLAGVLAKTWAFANIVPGTAIRARAGDDLRVDLDNGLPEPTTIHWHGLALRNDMDGVHDLTQPPVGPGDRFTYRFKVPHSGTHWFHPHSGLQLDRGLYAPLIVEDPDDDSEYDVDHVVVLDDWLDGIDGVTPETALAALTSGGGMAGGMAGMDMGEARDSTRPLGADGGDVTYPYHLANGVPSADRSTVSVASGARVRVRIINAASDTAYRVGFTDRRLVVTHADGFAVESVTVDALIVGMGERYDLLVDGGTEPTLMVASAEGKTGQAEVVFRPVGASADAPSVGARPEGMDRRLLTYGDLRPTESVRLDRREVDVDRTIALTGSMGAYEWGIDGRPFADRDPIQVQEGQRVRLVFENRTMMWHPMHLHGHTFALGGSKGPRKDTVNVLPGERVAIEFDADNPGQWMLHCHNTYHLEAGMASTVAYVT